MKKSDQTIADLVAAEHSRNQVTRIIKVIGSDQQLFDELMEVFLGKDPELARRSAWALGYVAESHPSLVRKWLPKVLKNLRVKGQHPAMYRNTFRFLETIPIPEKSASQTFDLAIEFVLNAANPGAIRAFAMSTAWNVTKDFPDLERELRIVVEQVMKEDSPAIRSRGRKILSKIADFH